MALNFKCRIECTSVEQLNFNGYNVDTQTNCNSVLGLLQPENIDYIKGIQIVCRKRIDINYTLKSLEFFISRRLEESEFADLIRRMRDCGFRSGIPNNRIQFLDTSTTPMTLLYDYNFTTGTPNELIGINPRTNRYRYNTKVIYKR
jgi:hypothetical protein